MAQLDRYSGSPQMQPNSSQNNQLQKRTREALARIEHVTLAQVAIAQGEVAVSLAYVAGAHQVGQMGMPLTAALSSLAAQLTEAVPSGAHRYSAIADTVAVMVMDEILNLRTER